MRKAQLIVVYKTRNLQRTIRAGAIDDKRALVLAGGIRKVGYAAAVEFGTKPHKITTNPPGRGPRKPDSKAKFGSLAWGGSRRLSGTLRSGAKAEFFARTVNHPGTRAKPYLVPGAKAAMRDAGLSDGLIKAWNDAA